MQQITPLAASYRDNAGFVFEQDGLFYRCINKTYFPHYDHLLQSGLYKELIDIGRLISHTEIDKSLFQLANDINVKIILPDQLPFISYPYEWSFDMWKDAAIVTLKVMEVAMAKGMILKDATPFNIQFYNGRPVFIDTLSFEIYEEGKPWIAYRQFCECFLSPLLLMHYGHRDMAKFFMAYPEGIPLEITKTLLPLKSRFNLHVYMHVWMQSKVIAKTKKAASSANDFSFKKLQILIKGLLEFVSGWNIKKEKSTWDDYYTDTILGNQYLLQKKSLVLNFCELISFENVIDLGANDGYFSWLLKDQANNIIAVDFDSNCVNELYKKTRKEKVKNINPLVATLNTPSPTIGWANTERSSLTHRLNADLILALALVHHLAISNNVPLLKIAEWFAGMGRYLLIEFVPKEDEKVKQLLLHRTDIFSEYDVANFKKDFGNYYNFIQELKVGDTGRVLFLMERK